MAARRWRGKAANTLEGRMNKFRKTSGMARYERECRLTGHGERKIKAFRVSGTPEHGRHQMFLATFQQDEARRVLLENWIAKFTKEGNS